jgi:hypothetical protein
MLYLYGMPENVMIRTLEASLYEAFSMAGDVIVVNAYKLKGKSNGTGWIVFRGTDASEKAKDMLPRIRLRSNIRTLGVDDFDPELAGIFRNRFDASTSTRGDKFRQLDNN